MDTPFWYVHVLLQKVFSHKKCNFAKRTNLFIYKIYIYEKSLLLSLLMLFVSAAAFANVGNIIRIMLIR